MKKADQKRLSETLDKALEPPSVRRKPALATRLSEYDDEPQHTSAEQAEPTPRTAPHPPNAPTPVATGVLTGVVTPVASEGASSESAKVASASRLPAISKAGQQAQAQTPVRGRGRPPGPAGGKRDNQEYTQASAYIRKDTHRRVKAALILEGKGREYSELVEELLNEWLNSRN
jgi:hypothetical protein